MTPSELLELAGIVYPDDHWEINGNEVIARDIVRGKLKEIYKFAPSLKSEGRPAKQALDVIVAAFALDGPFQITGQDDHHFGVRLYSAHYRFEKDGIRLMGNTGPEHDILTASAMALLADRGKG